MSLDLLDQFILLLAAVVIAFAISSVVGMLVAGLLVMRRPIGGAPDEPSPRSVRADHALKAPAGRPPGEGVSPISYPIILTSVHGPARWQAPAIVGSRRPDHPERRAGSAQVGHRSFRASAPVRGPRGGRLRLRRDSRPGEG